MRTWFALLLLLAAAVALPACGGNSNVTSATNTVNTPSFAGVWTGTATDSTGTPLGTGLSNNGATMTWTLTSSGNQVNGTVTFPGLTVTPSVPPMNVSGTVSGSVLTYTITIPPGAVALFPSCTGTINGTLTMAPAGNAMNGNYSGSTSCSGAIANGQLTLQRQ